MVHSECDILLTGCLMLSSSPRDFPSETSGVECNLISSLHFLKILYAFTGTARAQWLPCDHRKRSLSWTSISVLNFTVELTEAFLSFIHRYISHILVQLHGQSNNWYTIYHVPTKITFCFLLLMSTTKYSICRGISTCVCVCLNNDDITCANIRMV